VSLMHQTRMAQPRLHSLGLSQQVKSSNVCVDWTLASTVFNASTSVEMVGVGIDVHLSAASFSENQSLECTATLVIVSTATQSIDAPIVMGVGWSIACGQPHGVTVSVQPFQPTNARWVEKSSASRMATLSAQSQYGVSATSGRASSVSEATLQCSFLAAPFAVSIPDHQPTTGENSCPN